MEDPASLPERLGSLGNSFVSCPLPSDDKREYFVGFIFRDSLSHGSNENSFLISILRKDINMMLICSYMASI